MNFARLDFSKSREFQTTFGLSGSGTSDVDTSQLLCRPGRVIVVKPEEETRSFFSIWPFHSHAPHCSTINVLQTVQNPAFCLLVFFICLVRTNFAKCRSMHS